MVKGKVVNVKVEYIRPLYRNLKEWMADEDNVYIGRAGAVFVDGKRFPGKNSVWANPYRIRKKQTRDKVIERYRDYIKLKIKNEHLDLDELRGKNLGCWCKPEACHGDILLDLLEDRANAILYR